ncbi:reelin-like [Tubulanus polymorphus]|uniref:reelin-like n=1 Tax=Tubulanus polymorphus TaxID=672921 RepID=UPI003DA48457
MHIIHLPEAGKTQSTCVRWYQNVSAGRTGYSGCWVMDNVVITNLAHPLTLLEDNFDPVNSNNWLFFPGAAFQRKCRSDGMAAVFTNRSLSTRYITTRDLDLRVPYNEADYIINVNLEESLPAGWIKFGGDFAHLCGSSNQRSLVYNQNDLRLLCSPWIDLRKVSTIRFQFTMGTETCVYSPESMQSVVYMYVEDWNGNTNIMESLKRQRYQTMKEVSTVIPPVYRKKQSRICWRQDQHSGPGHDTWAISSIRMMPNLPVYEVVHYIQFSLNLQCGRVKNSTRWMRFTFPIPNAALMPFTRFRWSQASNDGQDPWALDNVYIGPCKKGCNGHGKCEPHVCRCDKGYSGSSCERSENRLPDSMVASFSSASIRHTPGLAVLDGADYCYKCGVISSGKALVFNRNGQRQLVTADFNTSAESYLQFSLRVGSNSASDSCPCPDHQGEDVILQYSCDGGIIWKMLETFSAVKMQNPRVLSVKLPSAARKEMCRFRWWQPNHSGPNHDVWALDDISITNTMYSTVSLNFSDVNLVRSQVETQMGTIGTYCGGSENVMVFSSPIGYRGPIHIITNDLKIGPSYVVQFDLAMTCSRNAQNQMEYEIVLEYSTDSGITWSLVEDHCLPPAICEQYSLGTSYTSILYQRWKHVIVILPEHTWSSATQFRIAQKNARVSETWAVDNLYIGPQCRHLCSGHGYCENGVCICDVGYDGPSCTLARKIRSTMHEDFSRFQPGRTDGDWLEMIGGKVANRNPCGAVVSGEWLQFNGAGLRMLVSNDFDTTRNDYIDFYVNAGIKIRSGELCKSSISTNDQSAVVLVEYSRNGGIHWKTLHQITNSLDNASRYVHVRLPDDARFESTRFRWWQPYHHRGHHHWAIDEIHLNQYQALRTAQDEFERGELYDNAMWKTVTGGILTKYCQSKSSKALVIRHVDDAAAKMVITHDFMLKEGNVIQFQISVGCSESFSYRFPVFLEYSHDNGQTWQLVETACYQSNDCKLGHREGSVFHSGTYGKWRTVLIPVSARLAAHRMSLRWYQDGGSSSSFALDNIYVGVACPDMCNGNGLCRMSGKCLCDNLNLDVNCASDDINPNNMTDLFDNTYKPSSNWKSVRGGQLSISCGVLAGGKSLYFGEDGTREAVTKEINTTSTKYLQFHIKIGDSKLSECRRPERQDEGVIVQYSTNRGMTWNDLRILDPFQLSEKPRQIIILLPANSKSPATIFRWWQPILTEGILRAQWAIDNVVIGGKDINQIEFEDTFAVGRPVYGGWFRISGGDIGSKPCNASSDALLFNSHSTEQYAETWDLNVNSDSFLQFDLRMGCGRILKSETFTVGLYYSIDTGITWYLLMDECLPPDSQCGKYKMGTIYHSEIYNDDWKRVTLKIPLQAVSSSTRFKWKLIEDKSRGNSWAIDNIYIGSGCEWMCSGHGTCLNGICTCDSGFVGEFCAHSRMNIAGFKETFERTFSKRLWSVVIGGSVTNRCGTVVNGQSLTVFGDGLRLLETQELDTSHLLYTQFYIQYGCRQVPDSWPVSHSVLLQFSTNAGVDWVTVKEIHHDESKRQFRRFYHVALPVAAKSTSTKFRFWQPKHGGSRSVWSIDNLVIGGHAIPFDSIYDTFDTEPHPQSWLFWPGGEVIDYCTRHRETRNQPLNVLSLAFLDRPGYRYITTEDLTVHERTIVQFDINVGCSTRPSIGNPVYLQYSIDFGKTWTILMDNEKIRLDEDNLSDGYHDSTIYYSGLTDRWRRVVFPLKTVKLSGLMRFRWYQGFFTRSELRSGLVPQWAIDNVYIGTACSENCYGHGTCINGQHCKCDKGYSGDDCAIIDSLPTFLKEEFSGDRFNDDIWLVHGSGEINEKCGKVFSGKSAVFLQEGKRVLETQDLDLSTASFLQFHLKFGCVQSSLNASSTLFLQYSTDGAITWKILSKYTKLGAQRIAAKLPSSVRKQSVRFRWFQPLVPGKKSTSWAIDQVYIGGHVQGFTVITDTSLAASNKLWITAPHRDLQELSGASESGRIVAETIDIVVSKHTYIDFELVMKSKFQYSRKSFGIELQYSMDMGKTWKRVKSRCLPSMVDCVHYDEGSIYESDRHSTWKRHVLHMPEYSWRKEVRFRWFQPDELSGSWALQNVYIGDECDSACSSRGRCVKGQCKCYTGYDGSSCERARKPLQTGIKFSFDNHHETGLNWIGGVISNECGVLASGLALYFSGENSRILETEDLDLTNSRHVQFRFKLGCNAVATERNQGVLVQFTIDKGSTWWLLQELYFNQYQEKRFVSIPLPSKAKTSGVQIRWWQPHNQRLRTTADWAIDDVLVTGMSSNPAVLKEEFAAGSLHNWLGTDNAIIGPYCGSSHALVGHAPDENEIVSMTTIDLDMRKGYMLQFDISVGCNASWDVNISPIHLQYSVDSGVDWKYLYTDCLLSSEGCRNGDVSPATVYHNNNRWHRVTVKLPWQTASEATRFRWYQELDKQQHHWGIDSVYIGPACERYCGGHGWCDYPNCICELEYSGHSCEQGSGLPNTLIDDFENVHVDITKWLLVQGGHISNKPCHTQSRHRSDDRMLVFSGTTYQQAVTVDLDLRNARFIQVTTRLCNNKTNIAGEIYLQYSITGGMEWRTLHIFSPVLYTRHKQQRQQSNYINLPSVAKDYGVRLRWFSSDPSNMTWSIDQIYIGGSDINPSSLHDTFHSNLASNWEFHPGGSVRNGVCGYEGTSMMWQSGHNHRPSSLTTRQLIVQNNYIIQFKLVIGCEEKRRCGKNSGQLHLEYNTNPANNQWKILKPTCLPSGATQRRCQPFNYDLGSVFTSDRYHKWSRVTLTLPLEVHSTHTRFRWTMKRGLEMSPSWAITDIYVGEQCPELCNSHGVCVNEKCICDEGYSGRTCKPQRPHLLSRMKDKFEAGISPSYWQTVTGGNIGQGCGTLLPHAHGKTLYFNGCADRLAVTQEIDTTNALKLMFVLQIGSIQQTSMCNLDFARNVSSKLVLLQYSKIQENIWHLLASHNPLDFIRPRRVSYSLPPDARAAGTQFRWWQPHHDGRGYDQWALDRVEIVMKQVDGLQYRNSG